MSIFSKISMVAFVLGVFFLDGNVKAVGGDDTLRTIRLSAMFLLVGPDGNFPVDANKNPLYLKEMPVSIGNISLNMKHIDFYAHCSSRTPLEGGKCYFSKELFLDFKNPIPIAILIDYKDSSFGTLTPVLQSSPNDEQGNPLESVRLTFFVNNHGIVTKIEPQYGYGKSPRQSHGMGAAPLGGVGVSPRP